jgi:hypothetical protein
LTLAEKVSLKTLPGFRLNPELGNRLLLAPMNAEPHELEAARADLRSALSGGLSKPEYDRLVGDPRFLFNGTLFAELYAAGRLSMRESRR